MYVVAMYVSILPVDVTGSIVGRAVLSLAAGVGATIVTAPLFLIVMIFFGVMIRFAKDCCLGGCALCTWFRKQIGGNQSSNT